MIIWNTNKIIEKYNNGDISESQKFISYFIVSIISSVTSILTTSFQINTNSLSIQSLVIQLIVWIIGVIYVYYKYRPINSTNFIEKYFILLLPTTIKYLVIYYPIYFLLYTLLITPGNISTGPTTFLWIIQLAAWTLFYTYIGKKIQLLK
jgi:hypothetical protein